MILSSIGGMLRTSAPVQWFKENVTVGNIQAIAKRVLLCLVAATLFYLHSNLFVIGFAIGFHFSEAVMSQLDKIKKLLENSESPFKKGVYIGLFAVAAAMTLPATLVTGTLYCSAYLGAQLGQYAG